MSNPIIVTPQAKRSYQGNTVDGAWLFVLLITLVALAPLPLGSNRPLPVTIWGIFIGALLVFWSILTMTKRLDVRTETATLIWPGLCYLSVCFWVFLQWVPRLSPQFADPIWESAATLLSLNIPGRLSVNPEATLTGLVHLFIYGAVFWLTFQLTRKPRRAWTCIRLLSIIGAIYSLYGIVVFISGNNWILIYPKWAYTDSLTSTFVNRNSFATFAGLSLLCAVILLLDHLLLYLGLKYPLRAKTVLILEELIGKSAWKTGIVLIIAIALLLSSSRAGVASTMIGLVALLSIYAAKRSVNIRHTFITLAAITFIGLVTYTASGAFLTSRLDLNYIGSSFDVRLNTYEEVWNAILTTPWTGTGFSTFADVFPAYRTPEFITPVFWDKAHNTYLENALELGLPAAGLLDFALLLLALKSARGAIKRRRDALIPALGFGATALVGIHSLVDFSLQIPAVSIFYACIMGVAVSQSISQRQRTVIDDQSA